jgi:hypothetical protein
MPAPSDIRLRGGLTVTPRAVLLAAMFLLLALPLGVVLAVQVPLGHVPDEPAHVMRAAGLLRGGLIGHRAEGAQPDGTPTVRAMVLTDPALAAAITVPIAPTVHEPVVATRQMILSAHAVPWTDRPAEVDLHSIAGYSPLFYLPGAAAIGVTRLAGGSPYAAFLAARLANVVLFALAGGASLLLARRGAALMFCALVLPMTLNLAASASQDGLLLAATALALALLSRAAEVAGPIARSGWYHGAAVLIACVIMAKPPYLPMAALLLLPLEPAAKLRRQVVVTVLACLPALLWAVLAHGVAGVPHDIPRYEAGPLWPGPRPAVFEMSSPAAQLQVLLAHPSQVPIMAAATLWRDHAKLVEQVIGQLGWLNVLLPDWLYAAWLAALAAAALADIGGGGAVSKASWWRDAPLVVAAVVLSMFLILVVEYLTWAPVGSPWMEGVQGRYFLPLLPLLGRAVPVLPVGRRFRWLLLAPLSVAAADVAVLPRLVISWYYLS